jgi:hypothetical protein
VTRAFVPKVALALLIWIAFVALAYAVGLA